MGKDQIWLSPCQNRPFADRAKLSIETYTQLEWDWWPLAPKMKGLREDQTRLF